MATPATSRSHFPAREPTPVARLTRDQLAARVYHLRGAMDRLVDQVSYDGGEAYSCYGALKVCLIDLEGRLREMDRQRPAQLFAAAVNDPPACARVRAADLNRRECERGLTAAEHAELAELLRTIAVAGAVGMAGGAR